jgi:hypothetical protein
MRMRISEPWKTVLTIGVTITAVLWVQDMFRSYVEVSGYQKICAGHQDPEWCLGALLRHPTGRNPRSPGEWQPVEPKD